MNLANPCRLTIRLRGIIANGRANDGVVCDVPLGCMARLRPRKAHITVALLAAALLILKHFPDSGDKYGLTDTPFNGVLRRAKVDHFV